MDFNQRVTKTPLKKLENDFVKIKDLKLDLVQDLIKKQNIQFLIANLGSPLELIPNSETFNFWKKVKTNIAITEEVYLEDYPNNFVYFPSLWEKGDLKIILLETHH